MPALARRAIVAWALGMAGLACAQQAPKPPERSVTEWLARMQAAAGQHSYAGTFVVTSNAGALSSARVWHACQADKQVERVETLTGAPRSTFRRNDEVVTFMPDQRMVRIERREPAPVFPNLPRVAETAISEHYAARQLGSDRVAGFDADVVLVAPKDQLRLGYRIWSEKKTGLIVKLQTLGTEGEVLEQAAFSELQLDTGLKPDKLAQMMTPPEGWRVERMDTAKTTAAAEGWTLKAAVPGFAPVSCYRRRATSEATMQWVFSDGLATVSLFVEPFDAQRHGREGIMAAGATQTLTRRIQDWWLTAVGEVPAQTLRAFAQNLERRK
ncbi:MAG TPA: MucB/RseB C-terminal domain-containing protein [Ramlibacter sp.]|nr:MucB/RseB C-terminal domain-containing protein [Ramlibacter sp.]